MNPLIQFNIIKMGKPMNLNIISLFNMRSLVSTTNYKSCLLIKFQLISDKSRNISIYEKLHSSRPTFSPSNLDVISLVDDDVNLNSISTGSSNKTYGFKAECYEQEKFLVTQLEIESKRADPLTNQEWDEMKRSVLKMVGTINEKSIDAVIMNKCAELKLLSVGKWYFKYLKSSKILINRATYGNYLRLFFSCRNNCTSDDLNEIAVVYKELLEVYPVLDSNTAEKAICALTLTKNWKEYEKLLIAIKQFCNPSIFIYKIVIQTAFDHQEFELGWQLMEEMQYRGLNVPEEVFMYWFEKVKSRKVEEDLTRVLRFFNFFNMKPSDDLCSALKEAYEGYNEKGKVTFTRIARNGECRSCHSKLEPCYISQEEYDELKNAFLNPVIIGKDIFQKTKPEEFTEFLNFLEKSAPFNVVLDALNIAFYHKVKTTNECTLRLKTVVKHFVTLNKKILVLGRKHMAKWDTHHMEYVYDNAHVFLADNLSQDDPFMLYATLYSGLGSIFVSRDLMRGHKFLLADPKLQIIFQKWQSQHQYFINGLQSGRVYFQEPVSFLQTIQQNSEGNWHVPYIVKGEELTTRDRVDHLHRHWLCLQKVSPPTAFRQNKPKEASSKPEKEWARGSPVRRSTGSINIRELFRDDR